MILALITLFSIIAYSQTENTRYDCTLKDTINFRELSISSNSLLSQNHKYLINSKSDSPNVYLSLCNKIETVYLKGTDCSDDYFLVIRDGLVGCNGLKWEELTYSNFNINTLIYTVEGVIKKTGKVVKV